MIRLAQHKFESTWYKQIKVVTIEHHETREKALQVEKQAIKSERPVHNRHHNYNPIVPVCGNLSRVAERLGTTREKLYRMEKNGKFPVKQIQERTRLWNFCEVDEWFNSIGRVLP